MALRWWVVESPLGGLDADEAVWGLMSRRASEGHLDVFFWGQSYGGTQEVLLSVPVFAVLGSGAASVRAVPLLLFALGSVLVWRIGRRLLGEPGATAAAVFSGVWPAYLVWKSTRAHGFYGVGVVCSLLVLLFALRLTEERRARDAALLGLALGLGWWATPQIVFVALPVLLWLAIRIRRDALTLWPALPAALVGAAPWLAWNVAHPLVSLEPSFGPGQDTYVDHLRTHFLATFPSILGVRVPFTLEWLPTELVGRLVVAAVLVAAIALLVKRDDRSVLGAVVLGFPFVQSISPFASLNQEPRYLVLLAPVLALTLAAATAKRLSTAAITAVALVALTVAGVRAMASVEPPVPPVGGARVPADLGPALRALDRLDQRFVRAPYEVAYRITFESRERIVAASTSAVRYRPYQEVVAARANPAYVFVRGSRAERVDAPVPGAAGYRRIVADGWAVYVFDPR